MMIHAKLRAGALLAGVILGTGALGILLFAWFLPMWARGRMASNERAASAALKELRTAEADFRLHDRDGNGINDFWVGDVAGLFNYGRRIPLELARADARPLGTSLGRPVPLSGYHFIVLQFHQDEHPGRSVLYGQDTDGSGRKVRNTSSFGFCAYPAEYGVTGRHTLIINEGNTIFKYDMGGRPMIRWPLDESLQSDYEKLD